MSVVVAVALDATAGEPRPAAHPVVWTGRYLDRVSRLVPAGPPAHAVAAGGAAWLGGATAALGLALLVDRAAGRRRLAGTTLRGLSLWPLLSARLLLAEVAAVEAGVRHGPDGGRPALSRIVGRDTTGLSQEDVRAAAIESLAENLSDSVVAPLFWYVVAGLPGAALYRYANTADACWGHRTPRWEHAGRVAARVDDVLNLVPARLTALLLARRADHRRLRVEAGRTTSPNAGWPMAAMALRLDRSLAKRGHYTLNPHGAAPGPGDVAEALRLGRRTTWLATALAAAAHHLIRRTRGGPR